ncbi:HVO_A0114 family putative DNA-binding protein [Achromobacter aloeverae]|uniref:Uncharacterized protein n=1 Tax=Achromobacter aloeverae TaxID=1750518 RepID=A0A4Q1HRV6_9BURK|nr:hypothetical protein [Achromobacter aloeverae]RXN93401.1 hypothetical protein C7R54_06835 [Achromobacter aloeverae]
MERTLTITINKDWRGFLSEAGKRAAAGAKSGTYQGETLNFESPSAFFGQLTALRWDMVRELMGAGVVGVRELARRLARDVRRVHQDAHALVELGLLERNESGALLCPFADIHVDVHLTSGLRKAA